MPDYTNCDHRSLPFINFIFGKFPAAERRKVKSQERAIGKERCKTQSRLVCLPSLVALVIPRRTFKQGWDCIRSIMKPRSNLLDTHSTNSFWFQKKSKYSNKKARPEYDIHPKKSRFPNFTSRQIKTWPVYQDKSTVKIAGGSKRFSSKEPTLPNFCTISCSSHVSLSMRL